MSYPIVNYVRARRAFLPIMLTDTEAEAANEAKVTMWLKLLPEGQRELTEDTDPDVLLEVSYRAATAEVAKGWTAVPSAADALTLLPARHYQISGVYTDGSAIDLPVAIVKIRET